MPVGKEYFAILRTRLKITYFRTATVTRIRNLWHLLIY